MRARDTSSYYEALTPEQVSERGRTIAEMLELRDELEDDGKLVAKLCKEAVQRVEAGIAVVRTEILTGLEQRGAQIEVPGAAGAAGDHAAGLTDVIDRFGKAVKNALHRAGDQLADDEAAKHQSAKALERTEKRAETRSKRRKS